MSECVTYFIQLKIILGVLYSDMKAHVTISDLQYLRNILNFAIRKLYHQNESAHLGLMILPQVLVFTVYTSCRPYTDFHHH